MVPTSEPFRAKKSGVFPSRESPSRRPSSTSMPSCAMSSALPAATRLAPSRAVTPRPGSASKSSTRRATIPRSSARRITASASGCSLLLSRAAASLSRAFSDAAEPSSRGAGMMSVTSGAPRVIVPVLSSTMTSTSRRFSSASAPLKRMPSSAPLPVPTMMATGVASPSAQGQLMTTTETAAVKGLVGVPGRREPCDEGDGTRSRGQAGTKTAATLSAMRAMGALVALASSTSRMMRARLVSAPTRVAR